MNTFSGLGLPPRLLAAIDAAGLSEPTPIQAQAIPPILQGRDLVGLARTGTGKTAAFGLPLLARLGARNEPLQPKRARALVLVPTRELANQIRDSLTLYAAGMPLRTVVVVGGASLVRQTASLARGTHVLVATPGRLIDLLERGDVTLDDVGYLVLDEADHMLDMGFIHALRRIARWLPGKRQTLMFSATMPKDIEEIAAAWLRDPVRVQVDPPGRPAGAISQGVHFVGTGDKARLLETYLRRHPGEQALVFARTKHGADKLARLLDGWGFRVGAIHGNKSQNNRDRTLAGFRDGGIDVLVATDVAARGIDIPTVRHVYNHDLPNVPENYVHRIGRTARAGASGASVSFCAPAEVDELKAIEKLTGQRLPVVGGSPWPPEVVAAAPRPQQGGGGRQGQRNPARSRPGPGQARQGAEAAAPAAAGRHPDRGAGRRRRHAQG